MIVNFAIKTTKPTTETNISDMKNNNNQTARATASCDECTNYDEKNHKCTSRSGLFYGKNFAGHITESMAEATHDCQSFDAVRYMLTPKGCLCSALIDASVTLSDETLNQVWESFVDSMQRAGYLSDYEEGETNSEA